MIRPMVVPRAMMTMVMLIVMVMLVMIDGEVVVVVMKWTRSGT